MRSFGATLGAVLSLGLCALGSTAQDGPLKIYNWFEAE
jgi:hypothetical protein|eukprot:COSAG03_NODE_2381_length_2824_cov_2.674128_3_plen_38_part_00